MQLLDSIVARGSPTMANRVKALAGRVFWFALDKGYLPEGALNPVKSISGLPGGKEESRDRVLGEGEIRKLWAALQAHPEPTASAFRLMLLTGQRPGEVLKMRWDQMATLEGFRVWTVPATVAKNAKIHSIPLPSKTSSILEALSEAKASKWVFPSPKGDGPIRWIASARNKLAAGTGFDFRAHDLRRTAATHWARIGVREELVARLLNHKIHGETSEVYNRWRYLPEMENALERWVYEVDRIVNKKTATVARIG